ncbi:hypothetical protein [Candidatus Hecatella orcuttiae]|uniref:hypothetical protein n=1 Tax=Candidatus Hecatella orcuttiae TaxID=1935119 RepID=UPI002867DE79|nr:hypothetical protein [Candidatus Hecatella orcuttiae]
MATASLLKLDLKKLVDRVGDMVKIDFPSEVIEVSLEPKLSLLCIRFEKPIQAEMGEPVHPQIHLFRDKNSGKITAVEILDVDELLSKPNLSGK